MALVECLGSSPIGQYGIVCLFLAWRIVCLIAWIRRIKLVPFLGARSVVLTAPRGQRRKEKVAPGQNKGVGIRRRSGWIVGPQLFI